jgi:penicillin-binding protein 1C
MTKRRRWTICGILTLLIAGSIRICGAPLSLRFSSSQAVFDRKGNLIRLTLSNDDKYRLWVPLEEISPDLVEATLLKEDRWFHYHPGVNPVSIARAIASTYLRGSRRIGGSTITMQLARMVERNHSHTLSGKIRQIVRAIGLELSNSKHDILEAYLNLVPEGGNIEGVAAASLIAFHRKVNQITLPEAIALSEIPQNPNARSFLFKRARILDPKAIARWMKAHPDSPLRRDSELPVQSRGIQDLPFRAPHFAERALFLRPNTSRLDTSLNLETQKIIESQVSSYIAQNRRFGIRNASVMLFNAWNGEVEAVIGSANYFDASISGQINGTLAKRSPGSTLKPFVYGLAFDQGLIHPQTMLKDSPTSFGAFDPENFDHEFTGPVTAYDALIRSRNIPAVSLFSRLKPGNSLYQLLEKSGVTRMKAEHHYGYALPLGGSEVTMEEMVRLYSAFVLGGELSPVRYFPSEPAKMPDLKATAPKILSPQSSHLVYDILAGNPRPDQTYSRDWVRGSAPVAWKTGTSHGFRDAWSIGIIGDRVLAVWLGNFDGTANSRLIGRNLAGPLFFRIVDALRTGRNTLTEAPGPLPPRGLTRVKVCSLSGQIPGKHCKDLVQTWFIPGVSPIHKCEIHRSFKVNRWTGERLCSENSKNPYIEKVFEIWPSDLLDLFRKAGIGRRTPPPYEKDCAFKDHAVTGVPPVITSPRSEMTYLLRVGDKKNDSREDDHSSLALSAQVDGDVRYLHWFMNDQYLGKSSSEKPLFWNLKPGRFLVRAVDDQGRSATRSFRVSASQ